jgi:hypothetical protein
MTNPSPSAGQNRGLPFHRTGAGEKGARNLVQAKIQRNPLKTLDSDERIQGNPSLSNPQTHGFRGETFRAQENPNLADRTERRGRRGEGAKPTPSKCKAI